MYPSNKVIKQQAKVARWFFFTLSVFVFLFVNAYILMPQATDVPLIAQVGDSEVNLGTSGGQFGCGLNDIEFVNFVHEYCEAPFWDEAGFSSAEACFEDAFDARGTNCDEEDFGTDSGATCAEVIADCQRATGGSSADLQQCVSDKKPSCVGLGDDQPDGPTTGDDQPDGPTAGGQGRPLFQ